VVSVSLKGPEERVREAQKNDDSYEAGPRI
jgi:hypothetical protein